MKKKYYPILLCRAGELQALKNLDDNIKNNICPIIQIENTSNVDILIDIWNNVNYNLIVDFSLFTLSINHLDERLDKIIQSDTNIIPLLSPKSTLDYKTLIDDYIFKKQLNEICYSIKSVGDIKQINSLLKTNGLMNFKPEKINIQFDLGHLNDSNFNNIISTAEEILKNLTNTNKFKSIIISSGAIPIDLSKFSPKTLFHYIKRLEFILWNEIKKRFSNLENLCFSDYGIKSTMVSNGNFTPSCSIKYTVSDFYVVLRGEQTTRHIDGHGQYINHCKELVKSNYYLGENYSWGDGNIMEKSKQQLNTKNTKPGNATTWVSISQNHHITLIHNLL